MSYTPIFQGEVKKGRIEIIKAKRDWKEWIKSLEGKKLEIVVKEWKETRSNAQNRLMWSWFQILEDDSGQPKEDYHDYFKKQFLCRVIKIRGKLEKVVGSTAILNTKEMSEHLEKIREAAATLFETELPDPYDWF